MIRRSPINNNAFPSPHYKIAEKQIKSKADGGQHVNSIPDIPDMW